MIKKLENFKLRINNKENVKWFTNALNSTNERPNRSAMVKWHLAVNAGTGILQVVLASGSYSIYKKTFKILVAKPVNRVMQLIYFLSRMTTWMQNPKIRLCNCTFRASFLGCITQYIFVASVLISQDLFHIQKIFKNRNVHVVLL